MKKSIIVLVVMASLLFATVILLDGCASNSLHYLVSDFVNNG